MRIFVDADACPVKSIIVSLAKRYQLEVHMYFDTSHIYEDGYSKVITIDQGRDAADFALVNALTKGDIVVTQDYGVASMALTRGAHPIHQNGFLFTHDNMDYYLQTRYLNQKERKRSGHIKGPAKRTKANDEAFELSFDALIRKLLEELQ